MFSAQWLLRASLCRLPRRPDTQSLLEGNMQWLSMSPCLFTLGCGKGISDRMLCHTILRAAGSPSLGLDGYGRRTTRASTGALPPVAHQGGLRIEVAPSTPQSSGTFHSFAILCPAHDTAPGPMPALSHVCVGANTCSTCNQCAQQMLVLCR